MTRKKPSRASKVRAMLNRGMTPKEIADQLGIKRQIVYTIRYMDNKKKGIGALPKPELKKDGIASVRRKAGRPPRKAIVVPPEMPKPGEFVRVSEMEREAKESTQWILVTLLVVVALGVVILAVK